mgnify:FL=1
MTAKLVEKFQELFWRGRRYPHLLCTWAREFDRRTYRLQWGTRVSMCTDTWNIWDCKEERR